MSNSKITILVYLLIISVTLDIALVLMDNFSRQQNKIEVGLAHFALNELINEKIDNKNHIFPWVNTQRDIDRNSVKISSRSNLISSEKQLNNIPTLSVSNYSYDAVVTTECSPINLNCYTVNYLYIKGKRYFEPRL